MLLIILNLGLRAGEALALEWRDIDLDKHIIDINKTMQSFIVEYDKKKGKNNRYARLNKETKSVHGLRVLPLNESTEFYIRTLKDYDLAHNIKCPYVVCTHSGTRQIHRNLQRSLDLVAKRGNLEHISLHTLRHTFGSTMIRRGVSVEVVSKLMGHSKISITYNKYIHVIKEQKALAMEMTPIC